MTHYQKLATMIFRIVGLFFLVLALISFVIALIFILLGTFANGGIEMAFPLIIYFILTSIIGGVFFKLSKKLAGKVCFDFNE